MAHNADGAARQRVAQRPPPVPEGVDRRESEGGPAAGRARATAHLWRRGALALALVLGLAVALLGSARPALANRFGPPWQAKVTAEQTIVYSQPDRALPVGPLAKGAIVVVLGEEGAWTRIPDGYVPTADIAESDESWVAEVSDPAAAVYAKPMASSDIRLSAQRGRLLRVTGISPGLEGDPGIWWATTEGYVGLHSIRRAEDEWAQQWTLPAAEEAAAGWWGQVRAANVRAAPTTEAPIVGQFAGGERVKVLAEEEGEDVGGSTTWYRIDGGRFAGARVHSSLIQRIAQPAPTWAPPDREVGAGPWIVVDRTTYTLTYFREGQPRFTTYVALGKAGVETPAGTYGTFGKYRVDDMTSSSVPDATAPYDLPNVPFVQYYKDGGYAIHGTYWHDNYGTNQSQGCVNLTWTDAAYLFGRTQPDVPSGDVAKWTPMDTSTPVVILGG